MPQPHHAQASTATALAPPPPIPPQEIALGTLLACRLLEAAGSCARCLGPRLAPLGRPLRALLLPMLCRLADPVPVVRTTAMQSLYCLCLNCGFGGGLGDLVGRNADYVVDALCRCVWKVWGGVCKKACRLGEAIRRLAHRCLSCHSPAPHHPCCGPSRDLQRHPHGLKLKLASSLTSVSPIIATRGNCSDDSTSHDFSP